MIHLDKGLPLAVDGNKYFPKLVVEAISVFEVVTIVSEVTSPQFIYVKWFSALLDITTHHECREEKPDNNVEEFHGEFQ